MAEKDRFVSPAGFRLYRLSSAPGSYSLFCRFRSWLQREAAMARVARQQQQDGSIIKKVQRKCKKKKNNKVRGKILVVSVLFFSVIFKLLITKIYGQLVCLKISNEHYMGLNHSL